MKTFLYVAHTHSAVPLAVLFVSSQNYLLSDGVSSESHCLCLYLET